MSSFDRNEHRYQNLRNSLNICCTTLFKSVSYKVLMDKMLKATKSTQLGLGNVALTS